MGLVGESDERPDPALDDERRRYYRLTSFGEAGRTSRKQTTRGTGTSGSPEKVDRQWCLMKTDFYSSKLLVLSNGFTTHC